MKKLASARREGLGDANRRSRLSTQCGGDQKPYLALLDYHDAAGSFRTFHVETAMRLSVHVFQTLSFPRKRE
ncbi:MAG: hypothetical protein ABI790_07350, partial [Betaproteobacteria bacterium]